MRHDIALILLFFSVVSRGQINIINQRLIDTSLNILYIGVDNIIEVKGYTCHQCVATIAVGGTIMWIGKNKWVVRVTLAGTCRIVVNVDKGKKLIEKNYTINFIDPAYASLAGFRDTSLPINRILENPLISVITPGCYYDFGHRAVSFTATFIQGYDSVSLQTVGNQFSREQIKMAKELQRGDSIYFDGIKVTCYDCRIYTAPPFWIKIE